MRTSFYFLILLWVLSSCDIGRRPVVIPYPIDTASGGLLICNEGNFQFSNATLTYANIEKEMVVEDIYNEVNNENIGDVLQSASIINDKIYLVVNNSSKIIILNKSSFKKIGNISGLKSPRYLLKINDIKGYVTDLYDNNIFVIDLLNDIIVNKIPCKGWTEELLSVGNFTFVTNLESKYLSVIDNKSDKIVDSIDVGFGSNSLQLDAENKIWVLSKGDEQNNFKAKLSRINPNDFSLIKSFVFNNAKDVPSKLQISTSGNNLYWINSSVYSMNTKADSLPSTSLIKNESRNFYGLSFDKKRNEILVTDVKDYLQKGTVFRYNPKGILIGSINAGIIPSHISFLE